jgi:hypothetical protein
MVFINYRNILLIDLHVKAVIGNIVTACQIWRMGFPLIFIIKP